GGEGGSGGGRVRGGETGGRERRGRGGSRGPGGAGGKQAGEDRGQRQAVVEAGQAPVVRLGRDGLREGGRRGAEGLSGLGVEAEGRADRDQRGREEGQPHGGGGPDAAQH